MGSLPFITSLGIVLRAHMSIELKFKKIALSGLFSVLLSGALGIFMAYNGMGVWAVVAQTLGNYLFVIIFMRLFFKWYPSLEFSKSSFKYLWKFGSKLLLTDLINTIYVNLYSFIIAKRYSVVDAGLYNRAQTISMFPSLTISTIFIKVFYPIQCKIEDEKELRKNFFMGIRVSSYVVFPIMIGLIILAEPFVMVLLKEQWKPIVPILQILSLGYMFNPMMMLNSSILSVRGRTDLSLRAEIIKKSVGVILLLSLISFNVYIFCFSFVLYVMADIFIITKYVKKVINISLMDQIKEIIPVLLLSPTMGVFVYIATYYIDNNLVKFIGGFISGAIFYICMSYILKFKETTTLINVLKLKK